MSEVYILPPGVYEGHALRAGTLSSDFVTKVTKGMVSVTVTRETSRAGRVELILRNNVAMLKVVIKYNNI